MDLEKQLGLGNKPSTKKLIEFVNIKLKSKGLPIFGKEDDFPVLQMSGPMLDNLREKNRLLRDHLPPCDERIQRFIDSYLEDVKDEGIEIPRLPGDSFILERYGVSRVLSLPPDKDSFVSSEVESYRVKQGVIHNPKHDRRTTKGSFHIVEGGITIPADKIAVPKTVFARLLKVALNPPSELARLPFTSTQEKQAETFVSLLLRPVVVPEVPGYLTQRSLEVRFFAPGSLVSNLDFVESIFGNAGDPFLPENNAALDVEGWTGHSGCVILAPQLITLKKKDLGLPNVKDATERQKRDGMCWESEDELYNNGNAFKVTARDQRGVVVTLVADNYFGYCKKEVKTQISYSANLYGLAEEEHAGGALAFPGYDLGEDIYTRHLPIEQCHSFEDTIATMGDRLEVKPEGYAVDKVFDNIVYLPNDVHFNMPEQRISWTNTNDEKVQIKLLAGNTYILPCGYKIGMHLPGTGRRWRLVGTVAEGTFCHKPCTVSGGGKSEISKSIADAILHSPIFINDFKKDFDLVEEIVNRDYSDRYREDAKKKRSKGLRPLLSPRRSLGSVIKLLTPSPEYEDEYNAWLQTIPFYIKDLVFMVKRYWKPDWGDNWRERFSVDFIDGSTGHELKHRNNYIRSHYLRVGFTEEGNWRTFGLRKDFNPASKVQTEDDISASVVVPENKLKDLNPVIKKPSYKFVTNCEWRLFQRPDEAINRGYDKTTESDFSGENVFFSNYEPLEHKNAEELVSNAIQFSKYTEPMQNVIKAFLEDKESTYFVASSHPRIVNGSRSKNPRYLQIRPDYTHSRDTYLAEVGTRLSRKVEVAKPLVNPVTSVLAGRRNNPPDREAGVSALCPYNPVHYQELPELFMDFAASLTGKSPSTTGAGSEGALTKGPFNNLPAIIDLNNALVSYLCSNEACFSSAAGYVGPKYRVDHDISLLVPEMWSRMTPDERDPNWLIEHEYMEKVDDFDYMGRKVLASRLGYRINRKFTRVFMGRIFSNPAAVFNAEMLKPEEQDMEVFVEAIDAIVSTQKNVAKLYFEDGTIEFACPPLKALLTIMAEGTYEGKDITDPEIRAMFTREAMFSSDWYRERLVTRQTVICKELEESIGYLEEFVESSKFKEEIESMNIVGRLENTKADLAYRSKAEYVDTLVGTIGTDPAVLKS